MLSIILTGTKSELIRYLKAKDLEFATLFNKRLLQSSEWLVTQKIGFSLLSSQDDAEEVIATIGRGQKPVSKRIFRMFTSNNHSLSHECIDIYCKLFQLRDDRVAETHHDVNNQRASYQKFGRTIFLGNDFCANLSSTLLPDHIPLLLQQYFPADWKVEETEFIVLMMNSSLVTEVPSPDSWSMILIGLYEHKVEYCDPRMDRDSHPLSAFATNSLQNVVTNILTPVLRVVLPAYEGNWPILILENQYFQQLPLINQVDCGVYLLACVYFSIQHVPIFFDQVCINRFRKHLAYWILCGSMPF